MLALHTHLNAEVPEDERTPDTPELFAEMDSRARTLGHSSFVVWVGVNNYENLGGDDWTATRLVEELRAATPEWRGRRMSILAIDAGTTGVTAVVVTTDGRIEAKGYQEFRPALPAAGVGRALRRGDLAGDPRGDPGGPAARSTSPR